MSQAVSPSAERTYGLARVCRVWGLARSGVYHGRAVARGECPAPGKRGPCGPMPDADLSGRIRAVLAASPFLGEGHRKVWARLRHAGVRTSRRRVLRLMREAGLLAPTRAGHPHGPRAHDGTIIPERPDQMWGADMTTTLTGEGTASIFIQIDHATAECLGIHAAARATRLEALEPLRQAVRERFGVYGEGVACGLGLAQRHDHGSQYMSDLYQAELRFLSITASPAFIGEPEGNGCVERFIRTLKEQLLWVRRFETIEELRQALQDFKDRYNREWLIERHGFRTPREQRQRLLAAAAEAVPA